MSVVATERNWTVTEKSRNFHVVNIDADGAVSGEWESWFLLTSDRHFDNTHSDRAMQKRHLDLAVERGAGVIDCGDFHCAMQGKWDKRASPSQFREEYRERYLDNLVKYGAEFIAPYADNWVILGRGNHETSILKRHETDLTERTAEHVHALTGKKINTGGYGGWVRFSIKRGTHRTGYKLKYFHGSGGGGPVTRGVIQTNRMAVYLPDADIVVSGHTHDAWIVPIQRERINQHDRIVSDTQVHVKIPTYKDEYADGYGGWHIERGGPPKPKGAYWLRFYKLGEKFLYEIREVTD